MGLKFFIIALAIFATFRLIFRLSKKYTFKKNIIKQLVYVFPLFEMFSWKVFIVWVISYYFKETSVYHLIIVFLIILFFGLFAWYVLKDIISGIIFKTQLKLNLGEDLKINESEGKLVNMGFLSLQIVNKKNEIEIINYSKIKSTKILKSESEENFLNENFKLKCIKHKSQVEIITNLKNSISLSPWFIPSQVPEIKLLNETENYYEFEISVYVLKKEHSLLIEETLSNNCLNGR